MGSFLLCTPAHRMVPPAVVGLPISINRIEILPQGVPGVLSPRRLYTHSSLTLLSTAKSSISSCCFYQPLLQIASWGKKGLFHLPLPGSLPEGSQGRNSSQDPRGRNHKGLLLAGSLSESLPSFPTAQHPHLRMVPPTVG